MKLTQEEAAYYSRHILLDSCGTEGQLALKSARVLIIGAGGLACPVVQYLSAAGVGKIGIVDGDEVSVSNLQRQVLYQMQDIGRMKVDVVKQRMQALNPFIQLEAYPYYLNVENARETAEAYDIIVDATDNFPTRYLINDLAVLLNKPLVFGSIYKHDGQVSVFNYKGGPSYRCLYPKPPEAGTVLNCAEIGVLGILPGIIGCFQANEVLKIILGKPAVLSGKLLSYDALTNQQLILTFKRTAEADRTGFADDYQAFCGVLPTTNEISRSMFESNKTAYQLLDVRTDKERAAGHIGGLHIPLSELTEDSYEAISNKSVVVYCRSGRRSLVAIAKLSKWYPEIQFYSLKGGVSGLV